MFCVDQAFGRSAKNLGAVLGSHFSVDSLEQTSQRMGLQADTFLDHLPTPKKRVEGKLLVASADCKGVPLIKDEVAKVAAFETAKKNPGNGRMATVTSVYSISTTPNYRTKQSRSFASKAVSRLLSPSPRMLTCGLPVTLDANEQVLHFDSFR